MEHSEHVEEPAQPVSVSVSSPAEETHAEDAAPLSGGGGRAKSQHGHSDSMVTVRLSTMNRDENKDLAPPTPTGSRHEAEDQPESPSDDADEANTRPTSISTTSMSDSNRASTAATDDEDEPIAALAKEQPPSPSSSAVASDDTSIQEKTDGTHIISADVGESTRMRSVSLASSQSSGSGKVDWAKLDQNEEEEEHHEGTDESTSFLLAQLEQQNNALTSDPKAGLHSARDRKGSRPPSIQQLKKLVQGPSNTNLRYSTLPSPPPMTELEFWSALVKDYPQTALRLPTLTANKIRQGIPPPLRGVVWQSIAGARDPMLEDEYEKLCLESSPYENLIHKDIGRSFPGVDMFRDPNGDGQRMLGKVLKAFSLHDQNIGYCQGLGFVVGPLLMHMGDKEAFCTLVRLMDHYGLRSCFMPNLTGLHLRVYQFQHFLSQFLPNLSAHLEKINVEPLYITQWFLSFFGVTCPIPMLIRLYDVILTEGASETLMRVALSVMRRNEKKILATTEFEDVMQLLLSRSLWDPYNYNADDLMADFCWWTGFVTRESLLDLETAFKDKDTPGTVAKPGVHTAAQRFLGRMWNNTGALMSPRTPFVLSSPLAPPLTGNPLRRTPSKQSMASTLNSVEGSEASAVTASTDATTISRQQSAEYAAPKTTVISNPPPGLHRSNKDKDLHTQIEDLLMALNNMQREHSLLNDQLQREREERDEDRQLVLRIAERLKKQTALTAIPEDAGSHDGDDRPATPSLEESVAKLEEHFAAAPRRTSVMLQTKQQLREESARWKAQYQEEVSRSADQASQLADRDRELTSIKETLRDARGRVHEDQKEKQRLEKANKDLRSRKPTIETAKTAKAGNTSPEMLSPSSGGGLRELKLGRAPTSGANLQPPYAKRVSSLSTHSSMADDEHAAGANPNDTLVMDLANAKMGEAMARQELEEVKTKLESFRKLLSGSAATIAPAAPTSTSRLGPPSGGHSHSHSTTKLADLQKESAAAIAGATSAPLATVGGFFSGWGKRAVSNSG